MAENQQAGNSDELVAKATQGQSELLEAVKALSGKLTDLNTTIAKAKKPPANADGDDDDDEDDKKGAGKKGAGKKGVGTGGQADADLNRRPVGSLAELVEKQSKLEQDLATISESVEMIKAAVLLQAQKLGEVNKRSAPLRNEDFLKAVLGQGDQSNDQSFQGALKQVYADANKG